jgi:mono/diheme cytochrome c family protein
MSPRVIGWAALGGATLALPLALLAAPQDNGLRPASSFASIADANQRSAAIFTEMGKVLTHPRCVNCHPRTDRPLQGDQGEPHMPAVVRGPNGMGAPGLECATCHGPTNVTFESGVGSVPGDPRWHLAPIEMAWEGKSLRQICEQLKDRTRNGGKSLAELHKHNAEDHLVGWGWNPGEGRTPAPGNQAEFGALTKAWIDSGAHCPA